MNKHMRKKKSNILEFIKGYIQNNLKEYTIVSILFLIGIVVGVIFINNMEDNQIEQINTYINNFIDSIKNNYEIDKSELLKKSIIENILIVLLIWFMGSTVIGIPIVYGTICIKGFSLGYTIASIMNTLGFWKGLLFNLSSLLLQNIIFIPCILSLSVSGIKLYKSIIKDKRKENIKIEVCRHSFFSLIIGGIILISSVIEVYLSSNILICIVPYI